MDESTQNEARMLAAIAAATLGGQGSPLWSRTAELLLLSSRDVAAHHHRALAEIDATLQPSR
jgi:hypothetical protein